MATEVRKPLQQAVALAYQDGTPAPKVVAKGRGLVAERRRNVESRSRPANSLPARPATHKRQAIRLTATRNVPGVAR